MGMYESKTPLWEKNIRLEGAKQAKGIAAYWGRQKIESLIDSARFDSQATEETKGSVKQQVIDVALKHHLVSPYTSLVAVEQVVARPAESPFSQKQVPQLLPKGSDHKMAHFPQTATSSKLYLLAGLICYMIGIGLYYLNGLSAPFRKRLV